MRVVRTDVEADGDVKKKSVPRRGQHVRRS